MQPWKIIPFLLCLLPAARAGEATNHWAFLPITHPEPPVDPEGWSDHPVDRFIRSKQHEAGWVPGAPAGRLTLIRRASFDLTGLPPSPAEVERFLADQTPWAFERLLDRLLASPHYGERWGRYWLDLARYADTAGENSDYPIREAYRYRDYVIDAFNQDLPYDAFIHEQLAGDILAARHPDERYAERITATGFLAQAKRFGTRKLEDMHLIIEDTLNTTGMALMGLTLSCARCHDHKYDPISMDDYYAMYRLFQSTAYPFPGGEEVKRPSEFVRLVPPASLARQDEAYLARHEAGLKKLEAEIKRIQKEVPKEKSGELLKPLLAKQKQIQGQKPSVLAPLAYAVQEGKPTDARVQRLGNPRKPGETVTRGAPAFLRPMVGLDVPAGTSGRLELARWITDPKHPLTARVMVNRIWQHHFGKAIVSTPSDFGLQGEAPTHPELLDWLATEFVARGWSIKSMHRLIMTSKTYQLSSTPGTKDATVAGSANRRYTRFDRRRLDAEAIRDSLLWVGGGLDFTRPGAHPFPPVEKWGFTAHRQFKAVYPSKHRSVYLMVQRLHHHPFLALFDGPDSSATTAVRDESTVAHQALFMANSPFVFEQGLDFGRRIISHSKEDSERVTFAYRLAYARPPTAEEADRALRYVAQYQDLLAGEKVPEPGREESAWASFARTLLAANEFIYVD